MAPTLVEPGSGIELSDYHISLAAAIYIAGACLGALLFGQLTDRFGRKRLFLITLACICSPRSPPRSPATPWFFLAARFFTGAGIGGEYAAINSAIDELIPARARGRVDLIINGSFWLGAAGGALLSILFLKESIFALDVGWRVAFGMGAVLGPGILFIRRNLPESPRWLFIHGREEEAERIVDDIERRVREETGEDLEEPDRTITVRQRQSIPFRAIARTAFSRYPKRGVLSLSLFVGQAFIYNAVTFTLGLTLTTYLGVAANKVGIFYAVFAAGNFLGPLLLGRLFDSVGRRPMITATYLISAGMLVAIAVLFNGEQFSDWGLIAALSVTFFFASAGASSAYLTVSEIFPLEVRALAIAFFYAIGTAIGGIAGPLVFERLASTGDPSQVMIGYLIGAGVMAFGGIMELFLGVPAEQRQLEDIAKPLTAEEAEERGGRGAGRRSGAADLERRRSRAGSSGIAPGCGASAGPVARPSRRSSGSRRSSSCSTSRSRSSSGRWGSMGRFREGISPAGSAPATGVRASSGAPSATRSATASSGGSAVTATSLADGRAATPSGEASGGTRGKAT